WAPRSSSPRWSPATSPHARGRRGSHRPPDARRMAGIGRMRGSLPVDRFWGRRMMKVPMTVEGAERLKAELQRLKTVERTAVIQALADARSQGDLSENADYDAAKERQGFIEGRISELEAKLAHARWIDPAAIDADGRVVFGATVEIEDLKSGDRNSYQI